ncbi:class Ib ribonucleoside-diphosphate reductase assembly flavoprotein NrdI [Bacillus cereus]|uniref:class Ib ribonucleoside-diphosphate reductase assembly flavoprotein NrdI n=1 Tax=Bacillus cereus TaxID=1396 RepID=UPI003980458C
MKVVYASMTGNVQRFVSNLKFPSTKIEKGKQLVINEPFVLITYTTGVGKVPVEVKEFLQHNSMNMVAVVGSGNRNWGMNFCKGAVDIATRYNVPLLHKFEISGLEEDVEIVTSKIRDIRKDD